MKRQAIDAVLPLFVAHLNLDGEAHAHELVALFDRATQKE